MSDYEYREYTKNTDEVFEIVSKVNGYIFSLPYSIEKMRDKTRHCKKFLAQFFFDGDEPIAFKIGYDREDYFYSWIGGVSSIYRGQKLATKLMERQHQWVREQGFQKLRTHTDDRFPEMISLNLKFGFYIFEKRFKDDGIEQIIMEKEI
ncbi:GNAT family N-acetyltransferase [Halobacteriovorax sp. DPLXC-1]|uniref:GNAT family N-acetyltransferase n=1 Tax=unclassified Halobacteriovorax TaxID=2639665 RepID=UPI002FEF06F6